MNKPQNLRSKIVAKQGEAEVSLVIQKIKKDIDCHTNTNTFARNDGAVDCNEKSLRIFLQ